MPITTLPTGRSAGPEPSGPPAARAGAPPGFLAALDTAAQTWTARAEGHSDNTSGSRNDAAAAKADAARTADAVRQAASDRADANDAPRDSASVEAADRAVLAIDGDPSSSNDAHASSDTPPDGDAVPTDAPVAPDTAALALLGVITPSVTASTIQTKISIPDTPIVPSATPPMVGATSAQLTAALPLPAAPAISLEGSAVKGTAGVADATPALAAGQTPAAAASVSDLLAAVAPTGAPAKLPAADLKALLDKAAAQQAAAAATAAGATPAQAAEAAAAAVAAANAKTASTSTSAQATSRATTDVTATAATVAPTIADPGLVVPAPAASATPAPAPATPAASPSDNAAAALAAAQAQVAAPAQPAPVAPPLSSLAQAIQAAAQQQTGSGRGASGGDSGATKDGQKGAAPIKAAVEPNPADAGAPLAGTQQSPGVVSTPAAPAVPTIQAPNPGAQAAAIEALVNLTRKDGASAARIKLAPEALGGIQVTLTFGANGVTAKLIADRPEAAAALNQAGNDLRDSLQNQGIDLASLETGFAGSMGQQGDQRSAQNSSGFGSNASSSGNRTSAGEDTDTTIHLALDDQSVAQQPLAAGRTIDLRA